MGGRGPAKPFDVNGLKVVPFRRAPVTSAPRRPAPTPGGTSAAVLTACHRSVRSDRPR
jgi:hypothetical protein